MKTKLPGLRAGLRRRLQLDQNHPTVFFGAGVFDKLMNFPNLRNVREALSSFLFEICASSGTSLSIIFSNTRITSHYSKIEALVEIAKICKCYSTQKKLKFFYSLPLITTYFWYHKNLSQIYGAPKRNQGLFNNITHGYQW